MQRRQIRFARIYRAVKIGNKDRVELVKLSYTS